MKSECKKLNILSDSVKFAVYTVAAVFLFAATSETPKLILIAIMAIFVLIDDRFVFVSIGCSNCMPNVYGVTLIVVVTALMMLKLIIKPRINMLRWSSREITVLTLIFFLCCHLFVSSFYHGDFTVAGNMATILAFSVVLTAYSANISLSIRQYLNSFLYGIGIVVFIGLLIVFNVPGYQSQHLFRLSIGERSDPNSTAFLVVLFCIAIFSSLIFDSSKFKTVFLKCGLFVAGIFVLLSTGSRGGFYSLVLGMVLAVSSKVLQMLQHTKLRPKGYFFSTVFFIAALGGMAAVYLSVNDRWSIFSPLFSRINIWEDNGSRLSLIKTSFDLVKESPLFGIGMDTFETNASHVPHNVYLDFLVSGGWVAMIIFLLVVICGIGMGRKISKHSTNPILSIINLLYLTALINLFTYSANNEKIFYLLLFLILYANRISYRYLS